jgi:uncharacterized membrane protein YeiB
LEPTSPAHRVEVLDALRGFSLLGICAANLMSFAGLYVMTRAQTASLPTPRTDRVSLFLIDWLVEGKFYTLFSLLFGIGLLVAGVPVRPSGRAVRSVLAAMKGLLCAFGLCYGAWIARAWGAVTWRARLRWCVPLGRIALTNYLGQSFLGLFLFYGCGLAWMGEFPFALLVPLAFLIVGAQRTFSQWWLRRWPQGPAERLWRLLAYGAHSWRSATTGSTRDALRAGM